MAISSTASGSTVRSSKNDVTARLITRFKELLAKGVLVPGSKLPPERELAEQFGVSRRIYQVLRERRH